ncbi:MAG: septum formation initiator family protein [Patescibacteria group bacterium]|nr:septum formation initiator family protein [Patescibacteria group bacterium]
MKKISFIIIIIISIFIINSLARSIYDLWKKQDLIVRAKQDLDKEKEENQKLKSQLSVVGNEQFIEEEARNKLFLAKPGEQEVIIPQELLDANKSAKQNKDNAPNWKKWWSLFF